MKLHVVKVISCSVLWWWLSLLTKKDSLCDCLHALCVAKWFAWDKRTKYRVAKVVFCGS